MLGTEGQNGEAIPWIYQLVTALIGVITLMLSAIIRKLFVSKADKAELLILAESIKQLREAKMHDHGELLKHLEQSERSFADALSSIRDSIKELNGTNRMLMQHMLSLGTPPPTHRD